MAAVGKRKVRVEVNEETLNRLLSSGQVCAAEFRCLDCKSKECLWHLCLKSCTNNLAAVVKDRSALQDLNQGYGMCRKRECSGPERVFTFVE